MILDIWVLKYHENVFMKYAHNTGVTCNSGRMLEDQGPPRSIDTVLPVISYHLEDSNHRIAM